MLVVLKAIILGIIQGISEPLPISSSGHIYLFKHIFNTNLYDSLNAFDQRSLIAKIDLCKNLFNKDVYETRTVIMRDKLDTAKIHDEDRRRGTEYNAIVPLNRETGLQDMKLIGGDPYPKNIVIPALGTEQVDAMITNERNRIVQEGLKRYAQGRENYSYRSEDDKGFIRSGFNDGMNL